MRKILMLLFTIPFFSTFLLAQEQKTFTIGFAHVDLNNPYYIAMEKEAYAQAALRGVKIIINIASNDITLQNKQVNALLDSKIDGLIINSVNEYGTMSTIKRAKDLSIPVVAIDRPLYGDYLAYVGIDQWRSGELQGEYIAKTLLPKGGNIVMMLGVPGEPATIGREGGMLNVLQHPKYAGKYKILSSYRADYNMDLGYVKMQEAIKSFGDKIDLVYCLNDAMALGALKALKEAKLFKTFVLGIDGQKEAYKEIENLSQFKATVINNPTEITKKAFDILFDYLQNKTKPFVQDVFTGTILVNSQNVKNYINSNAVF